MTNENARKVTMTRESQGVYTVTNAAGVSMTFGQGEGLLSPVELLLAAIAGCSSVDVDAMTSRRVEPERFDVTASADKATVDGGAILENIAVEWDLLFPEGDDGDKARARVGAALKSASEKTCTVSRTVEAGTPVEFRQV
ncbi:OsmC family protein [Demequina aurantiaca]|uniref:OsmC family protein n=1 Tax=Demequina aurantiaca TaxID=676200 RepID=UPI000784D8E3|nr:OsmC family protein [Demequina aurantiaca]